MKTQPDHAAFATADSEGNGSFGCSKRELFSAMALQGFISNPSVFAPNGMTGWALVNCKESFLAEYAVGMADALIAALNREPAP